MNLQTLKPRARQVEREYAMATPGILKQRVWQVCFPDSPTRFSGRDLDAVLAMAHRWRLHRSIKGQSE